MLEMDVPSLAQRRTAGNMKVPRLVVGFSPSLTRKPGLMQVGGGTLRENVSCNLIQG